MSKSTIDDTLNLWYWAAVMGIAVAILGLMTVILAPAMVGIQRAVQVNSHQYVEARKSALNTLAIQYYETTDEAHRSAIKSMMQQQAVNLSSRDIPQPAKPILNRR